MSLCNSVIYDSALCVKTKKNMHVSELKVGNKLMYLDMEVFVLDIFRDNSVELGYFIDSIGFKRDLTNNTDFKPIGLTDKFFDDSDDFFSYNHKLKGYLSGHCELLYNNWSKQMYLFNEVDGSVWNLKRIEHLHQLQNLFFEITNRHLILK